MDKFYEFIERALEKAEETGRTKRAFKTKTASALARASMAERERAEVGATRRAKIEEAGLGERLGREQEFARPLQTAETGRLEARTGLREAEAEKVRYGTEFERGLESTIKNIVGLKERMGTAKTGEAELSLREALREESLRDEAEAETEVAESLGLGEAPIVSARPEERAQSFSKRVLGFTLPGLGVSSVRDLLRRGKREEEYAYPGVR